MTQAGILTYIDFRTIVLDDCSDLDPLNDIQTTYHGYTAKNDDRTYEYSYQQELWWYTKGQQTGHGATLSEAKANSLATLD